MRGRQEQNRKRTVKACDWCRLKRSRCDNGKPCTRCRFDHSICISSQKKRLRERVYPKGYVEMLERQQSHLVAGLQSLYGCLQNRQGWPGQPLREAEGGHPLTHDILERLDLLRPSSSNSSFCEDSEKDHGGMQQKLLGIEMPLVRSRVSMDLHSGDSHTQSCPSFDDTTTVQSFPIKENLSPTQAQSAWLLERELPADWPTQANDGAPEATQISWRVLRNDITISDKQPVLRLPADTALDLEEFSQPTVYDRVYSSNLAMPDWIDVRYLDPNNLPQAPLSA